MNTLKIYIVCLIGIVFVSCKHDISPVGKWKVIQIRAEDNNPSQILKIDLTDSQSIIHYTDSVFMNGDFGQLKLDTSAKAIKVSKEMGMNFEGLQSTYLALNSDSTYNLDNQPMLFGFVNASDSIYKNVITGTWGYMENEKWLSFRIGNDDNRNYRVIKLSKDSLIIDDDMRNIKDGPPIKELTLIRQ